MDNQDLLPFLDESGGRLEAPYEYLRVGTKRLQGSRLAAHLRHLRAVQPCPAVPRGLLGYTQRSRGNEEPGRKPKGREAPLPGERPIQGHVPATLIVPPVKQTQHVDENGTYRRTAYIYHSSYADKNWKKFTGKRWHYVFEGNGTVCTVCLEEVSGTSSPTCSPSHSGGGSEDFIVMEADKMNAIKKYGEFKNYQDIYNSNTFFIFGVLSNMCKEAKQIEK